MPRINYTVNGYIAFNGSWNSNVGTTNNHGIILVFGNDASTAETVKVALYIFGGSYTLSGSQHLCLVSSVGSMNYGGDFSVSIQNGKIVISMINCSGMAKIFF